MMARQRDERGHGWAAAELQGGGEPGNLRRALEARLRGVRAAQAPPQPRVSAQDPADAAQAAEQELLRLATLRQRRHTVAEVTHALGRARAGRYGICTECEEPIPPDRLQALPFAVRCRPCQEGFERRPAGMARAARARRLALLRAVAASRKGRVEALRSGASDGAP